MHFYATTPLFRLSLYDSGRGSFDPHDPPGMQQKLTSVIALKPTSTYNNIHEWTEFLVF